MKKEWELKRLGDVCRIDRRQSRHRGLPYVGLEHIESGTGKFVGSLEPVQVKSSTFAFDANGVLFGRLRPYLKKVLLPSFQGHCSTEIFPLQPSAALAAEYLHYWFLQDSVITAIDATCTGARMPRADMDAVMDFPIPVPPLPEQCRIVAILDEAFEGIAAAKANAERNQRNAREVFESHLADNFNNRGRSWPIAKLEDVCGFQGGSQPPKSKFRYQPAEGFVRFLQIRDFASDKNMTYIPESKKNRLCESDDIMLGRYGASVGKVLTGLAGAYNVALIKTVPDESRITKRYLYHYLTSPAFQSPLRQVAARSAQDGFSREDIGGFQLALPPLAEQTAVVEMLDEVETECDRLGQHYSTADEYLDDLKASLLHQAFTGQL